MGKWKNRLSLRTEHLGLDRVFRGDCNGQEQGGPPSWMSNPIYGANVENIVGREDVRTERQEKRTALTC